MLATLCAAEMTEPAAARTPAAICEQMSHPQLYAEDAMLLSELKLLLILATPEATVDCSLLMALAIVEPIWAKMLPVLVWMLIQPLVTVVLTVLTAAVIVVWIPLHALVKPDLMVFHAVVVADWMPLQPIVTEDLTAFTAAVVVVFMPFHALVRVVFMVFHAVLVAAWMLVQPAVTEDFTAFSDAVTVVLMALHVVVRLVLIPVQTVSVWVLIPAQDFAMALSSAAIPVVTEDWMLAQELEIVEAMPSQEVFTSDAALLHAVSMLVLTFAVEVFVLPVMASQMPPKNPEMPSHAVLAADEMLSHALLAALFIPSHAVDSDEARPVVAVDTVVEMFDHTVAMPD